MAPLLSSQTLIRIHSAALLPISYYLLTSPSHLADQNLVFLLGESMSLPQPPSSLFSVPNPAAGLAALLAALLAITDLSASIGMEDEFAAVRWWGGAVLWRIAFFFGVVGVGYSVGAGAEDGGSGASGGGGLGTSGQKGGSGAVVEGWKGAVGNSLVFSWGFVELVFWFWVCGFLLLHTFCFRIVLSPRGPNQIVGGEPPCPSVWISSSVIAEGPSNTFNATWIEAQKSADFSVHHHVDLNKRLMFSRFSLPFERKGERWPPM